MDTSKLEQLKAAAWIAKRASCPLEFGPDDVDTLLDLIAEVERTTPTNEQVMNIQEQANQIVDDWEHEWRPAVSPAAYLELKTVIAGALMSHLTTSKAEPDPISPVTSSSKMKANLKIGGHIVQPPIDDPAPSVPAGGAALGVTAEVARKLLNVREALAHDNVTEAWHWLYKIADAEVENLTPWARLEALAATPAEAAPSSLNLTKENGAFIPEVLDQVLITGECGVAGHFRFQRNGNSCMMCQREAQAAEHVRTRIAGLVRRRGEDDVRSQLIADKIESIPLEELMKGGE